MESANMLVEGANLHAPLSTDIDGRWGVQHFQLDGSQTRLPYSRSLAAASERSMTRPSMNGPRSLMRTVTCLCVFRFVTRTTVGTARCDAPPSAPCRRTAPRWPFWARRARQHTNWRFRSASMVPASGVLAREPLERVEPVRQARGGWARRSEAAGAAWLAFSLLAAACGRQGKRQQ